MANHSCARRVSFERSPWTFQGLLALIIVLAAALAPGLVQAQSAPPPAAEKQKKAEEKKKEGTGEGQQPSEKESEIPRLREQVTVTGTRFEGRTAVETPAPVDVIGHEAIMSTGATETGKILQLLEPSANFSTTFISDGTDAIRPATLRSLGPDQTLVLVNGKRRHQEALINYQQTVGRGSAGYDINAIPASAIDHIEVLRDGAAAQYGSDAIAGVVNIILKDQTEGTDLQVDRGQAYKGDGDALLTSLNSGFGSKDKGALDLTVEYRDRSETNRAGDDTLRVSPPRVTQRIGDPDAKDLLVWINGSIPAWSGELYAYGGWSRRETNSSGFFRPAGSARDVPEVYPNGFLPTIITKPLDSSLVAGYRRKLGNDWKVDLSLNLGENRFKFREENTINVSYFYEPIDPASPNGPRYDESPTAANTGTLRYSQLVANVDVTKPVDWGIGIGPLGLAFGAEWRREGYKIRPGQPVSYQYGRRNDRSIPIYAQDGSIAQPGTQGFPGFSPDVAVDDGRHAAAAYVDTESQLSRKLFAGLALRYEDYSDFGSTVTGKLSGRIDFTNELAVRSTVSTGFRAPGVQQLFFGLRSTNLSAAGVLTDTLTAPNDSGVTRALGIPPLKEETSKNYSLGFVARPLPQFRLTVDAYRVDIDDRIIFSGTIPPEDPTCTDPSICPIGAVLNPRGIGQVQFFTNAIDTRTRGFDVVAIYDIRMSGGSLLAFDAALDFNRTAVERIRSASPIIPAGLLFDHTQVTLVERGQPRRHYTVDGTYRQRGFSATLRFNYFGEVAGEGFTPGFIQKWRGKWLTDLEVNLPVARNLEFGFGGLNIFDVYPDKWDRVRAFPFPQLGFTYGWETLPFGINGGYYYARLRYHMKR